MEMIQEYDSVYNVYATHEHVFDGYHIELDKCIGILMNILGICILQYIQSPA